MRPSGFSTELRERFAQFGLELHPDKTRLIEFGRYAAQQPARRVARGSPRPSTSSASRTCCAKTRKGRFTVLRQTMRKRMQAKLQAVKAELRRRMHMPIPEQGAYLRSVVAGHVRYYGVPSNGPRSAPSASRSAWLWWRALHRRSQRRHLPWRRMEPYVHRLASARPHLPSLSSACAWRHHPRQEPDAVMPHVRIRGGGYG